MKSNLKHIGDRLRAARKAAGYKSALSFTKKFNISPSTYSQHETGQRELTLKMLSKYSELLEVEANWLLTGTGPAFRNQKPQREGELLIASELFESLNIGKTTVLPLQTSTKSICTIDLNLFCAILNEVLDTILKNEIFLTDTKDVINFCIDIYNTVITTSVDDSGRMAIIRLAISSIAKGYEVSNQEKGKIKNTSMR